MTVTQLDIHSRRPFAGGAAFGEAGAYERLDGTIHFAVDPAHPLNEGIVDLDKAARDGAGRVHFSADFCLLQPVNPDRANGQLLLEVPNRGRKGALARFNRPAPVGSPSPLSGRGGQGVRGPSSADLAATAETTEGIAIGDGLLLRQGWTVAWCGWQWDVIRGSGLMGFDAPTALGDDGRPIQGQVLIQWQPDEAKSDLLLADRVHHSYPTADLHDPDAVLYVQEWPDAPRETVPREHWRFARDDGGRPVADDTHVWLEGGFRPGKIFQLVYRTRICPVVGAGLLAVRDCVAFLRFGTAADGNPCAGRIAHTFGYGSSQTGRFLRNFLYLGLNVDERQRQVFDGLLINVAGARRGEFNHRYAQPSVIQIRSFGYLPPFAFDEQTDPPTGASDGLLRRQRRRGGVPRIVSTNTSAECWNRATSLMHTDIAGQRDVEPPEDVRIYHFAGTKHAPGAVPSGGRVQSGVDGEQPQHLVNVLDFTPLLRAAFFNLIDWVTAGTLPPPSAFPRLADGTAADPSDVLAACWALPGITVPDPDRQWTPRRLDLGPDAKQGIGRFPAATGEPYPTYVSALDADGNEIAGIRLPDVSVPVGTHTGWFPRRPHTGGEGQNVDMTGSTIPFAPAAEVRERWGDPRPSIAERYASRDEYVAHVRAAAERLVTQRYLLPEDVDLVVQNAVARHDAFAGPSL